MKYILYSIVLPWAVMLSACASTPRILPAAPAPAATAAGSITGELFAADRDNARGLMTQGRYAQAAVEYRKLMDYGQDAEVRKEARMGLARCFVKMENFSGALKILRPFPEKPQTKCERHRLALAGEVLLRDERPEEAETLLEIALAGFEPQGEYPDWIAPCCENLGLAYLKNGKYTKAVTLYRRAADRYRACGKAGEAAAAGDTALSIETLLQ